MSLTAWMVTIVTWLVSIEPALAMAPNGGGDAGGSIMAFLPPFLIMFMIMYFLVWRPQKKQAETQKQFLQNLQKGDEVVTSGGIFGKVAGVADQAVTLEIAGNVKIKVLKGHIHKISAQPASNTPAAVAPTNVAAEK